MGTAALDLAPLAPAEGPESVEQSKLREGLDRAQLWWCHCPNGELRDPVVAARLCSQGVKTGVPDALIFSRCPLFPEARGIAIELKVKGGRVSADQRRWHKRLREEGWLVFVCWSAEEALALVRRLGWVIPPPVAVEPKPKKARKRVDANAVLARLDALRGESSSC